MHAKFFLSFRYEDEPHFRRKAVGCDKYQLLSEIETLIDLAGIVDFSIGLHDLLDIEYKSFSV